MGQLCWLGAAVVAAAVVSFLSGFFGEAIRDLRRARELRKRRFVSVTIDPPRPFPPPPTPWQPPFPPEAPSVRVK